MQGRARSPLDPVYAPLAKAWGGGSDGVAALLAYDPPAGFQRWETFAVLPSASNPRLLVPVGSRRAAAASFRQYNNATDNWMRLRAELTGLLTRIGVTGRVLRDRVLVVADAGENREHSLRAYLEEVLGRSNLELAVRLGPVRPNRKPVVQILDRQGSVLGYAKVGWEPVTRRLVHHESAVLQGMAARAPLRHFKVPRVLHAGTWRSCEVLVVAPFAHPRWDWKGGRLHVPLAAMREIAEGSRTESLAASRYWHAARERLASALVAAPAANSSELTEIVQLLEDRYGDRELSFGAWHGDCIPSNMSRVGDELCIWDWERSACPVPVGLDLMHFVFHAPNRSVSKFQAPGRVIDSGAPLLAALDVDADLAPLLLALDLLEMSLRFCEARAEGIEVTDYGYFDNLRDLAHAAP